MVSLGNYDEVIFAYICWSRTAYLPRIISKANEYSPTDTIFMCLFGECMKKIEYKITARRASEKKKEKERRWRGKMVACRCQQWKLSQWFMKIFIRKSSQIQFSLNLLSLNFRLLLWYIKLSVSRFDLLEYLFYWYDLKWCRGKKTIFFTRVKREREREKAKKG